MAMAKTDQIMPDPDLPPTGRQHYLRAGAPAASPTLLDVNTSAGPYRFELLTGHVDQPRRRGRHSPSQHAHDVYHIVLYTRGDNRFRLDGRSLGVGPGSLAMTAPGQPHEFGPVDPGCVIYDEITFQLRRGSRMLDWDVHRLLSAYMGGPCPRPPIPLDLDAPAAAALHERFQQAIAAAAPNRPETWLEAQTHIAAIFLQVIRHLAPSPSPAPEPDAIDRARRRIERDYDQRLTVEQLAREACCSQGHFSRRFKRRHGRSPIAYLHDIRIAAARNLLRSTHLPCKQIARRVGYADEFCFSRAFRRRSGQSPTAWRKGSVKSLS
jgi:AraC-like DNA-binding protein